MFDAPVDAWYTYVGIAAVSCAALGVAVALPTATAPDATAAAAAIDSVAATSHAASVNHPLRADEIRLRCGGVALRGPGGIARATLAYGPVTPVAEETKLRRLLVGARPRSVFDSSAEFRRAVAAARGATPRWRPAGARLLVRNVVWGGEHVTLVGA